MKHIILVKFAQRLFMRYLFILIIIFFNITVEAQENDATYKQAEEISTQLFNYIKAGEFEKLSPYFSKKLEEEVSTSKLEKAFSGIIQQNGAVEEALVFSQKITAEATYYRRGMAFEKIKYNLVFTLNEENKLNSLRIAPYEAIYDWSPPSYVEASKFKVEQIEVGIEKPLFGRYTYPTDQKSNIILIMVHGSGPNDMDGSVGPNKIFKDLAQGLASNGISSIRYNKRSYDYPLHMARNANGLTFDDVVVNDAVKAIEMANDLGTDKVILLGHSLGGHLAPRIAGKTKVDGVIVMAGNSSPLQDVLIPQYEHLMKYDSTTTLNDFQLNMLKSQLKNLKDGKYDEKTMGPVLPLSLPGSFWLNLKGYQAAKTAKKQDYPYLILNGGRDYQVPPSEAEAWKNGNKNKQSKTIIYPKLNHLFFSGEGICIPAEYERSEHLDEKVLFDMIKWMKEL